MLPCPVLSLRSCFTYPALILRLSRCGHLGAPRIGRTLVMLTYPVLILRLSFTYPVLILGWSFWEPHLPCGPYRDHRCWGLQNPPCLSDLSYPKALGTCICNFKAFGPKDHIIWAFWAVLSLRVNLCLSYTYPYPPLNLCLSCDYPLAIRPEYDKHWLSTG